MFRLVLITAAVLFQGAAAVLNDCFAHAIAASCADTHPVTGFKYAANHKAEGGTTCSNWCCKTETFTAGCGTACVGTVCALSTEAPTVILGKGSCGKLWCDDAIAAEAAAAAASGAAMKGFVAVFVVAGFALVF